MSIDFFMHPAPCSLQPTADFPWDAPSLSCFSRSEGYGKYYHLADPEASPHDSKVTLSEIHMTSN